MSLEHILDWLVKAAIVIGGWVWVTLVGRVSKLEDKHTGLETKVLEKYVRKEDWQRSSDRVYNAINEMQKEIKADIQNTRAEIKSDLENISKKIDTKADK